MIVGVWAGRAADENGVGREVAKERAKAKRQYKVLTEWAGKVMKKCVGQKPWDKEGRRWRMVNEAREGVGRKMPRHQLVRVRGKGSSTMRCKNCPQQGSTKSSIRRLKSLPCLGSVVRRATAFARRKGRRASSVGHLLCISVPLRGNLAEGVVWCAVCGAYAEKSGKEVAGKVPRAGDESRRGSHKSFR